MEADRTPALATLSQRATENKVRVAKSKEDLVARLVDAALKRTEQKIEYSGSYVKIPYPGGDVPANKGSGPDVVIRSYRAIGIDLQVAVHEDMVAAFDAYPPNWGLKGPDRNIDHRRVPNLAKFFARHGEKKTRKQDAAQYAPGDVVTWNVGRNGKHVHHIGIVVNVLTEDHQRFQVVHNIGQGPVVDDALFRWPITGHYRYIPDFAAK